LSGATRFGIRFHLGSKIDELRGYDVGYRETKIDKKLLYCKTLEGHAATARDEVRSYER